MLIFNGAKEVFSTCFMFFLSFLGYWIENLHNQESLK